MFGYIKSPKSPARDHSISLRKSPISSTRNHMSSPFAQDRFFSSAKSPLKSPRRGVSSENVYTGNMCDPYVKPIPVNTAGAPKSPIRSFHQPQITNTLLDAVGMIDNYPSKLIDFNPSGILAVALGNTVYLWSESMQSVQLREFEIDINALCWSKDGLILSGDGHVEIWDVNKVQISNVLNDHIGTCTAISSSGYRLATGGLDGYVKIYDLRAETVSSGIVDQSGIACLEWSPDGLMLASGGLDNQVSILASGVHGLNRKRMLLGSQIGGMQWLGTNVLFTGEKDQYGTIHRFSIKGDGEDETYHSGAPISALGWNDQYGLFAAHDDPRGTWEILTPDFRKTLQVSDHRGGIVNMTLSQDQIHMATIATDECLHICSFKPNSRTPTNSPYHFGRSSSPSPGRRSPAPHNSYMTTSFTSYQTLR